MLSVRPLNAIALVATVLTCPMVYGHRLATEDAGSSNTPVLISGTDVLAVPPAYPATDGHMVVAGGTDTAVWTPDRGIVELAPDMVSLPLLPMVMVVEIDGRVWEKRDLNTEPGIKLPHVTVRWNTEETERRDVRIYLIDENGSTADTMRCRVHASLQMQKPSLRIIGDGERRRLEIDRWTDYGGLWLFLDGASQGKMRSGDGAVLDTRGLSPGVHRVTLVAQRIDGLILPPATDTVTIAPRLQIKLTESERPLVVSTEAPDRTSSVRISRMGGSATGARVYLNDDLVADTHTLPANVTLPLRDVPTGNNELRVVGVGEDGVDYAPEHVNLSVRNEAWEQRLASTSEYQRVKAAEDEINQLEQDAGYWWTRALSLPQFVESNISHVDELRHADGSTFTMVYVSLLDWPTAVADCRGNVSKDILAIAQRHLEIARLYLRLQLKGPARHNYRKALQEAGDSSSTGRAARAGLRMLQAGVSGAANP